MFLKIWRVKRTIRKMNDLISELIVFEIMITTTKMSVRFEEVNTIQQYKSKHIIQVYASLNFGMKINDGERRIEEKFANHKMKQ